MPRIELPIEEDMRNRSHKTVWENSTTSSASVTAQPSAAQRCDRRGEPPQIRVKPLTFCTGDHPAGLNLSPVRRLSVRRAW